MTFENTEKESKVEIIISIVVSVVITTVTIILICCWSRRCNKDQTYQMVAYPVTTAGYGVIPFSGQIVGIPVAQPVV